MAYSKARRLADIVADTNGNINVPTQSASDNDTSAASTAYVTTAVSGLIDSAPSTLNTLNEIAAALNDDANFNTTVTNSIAAKLPLAGGTMTGDLTITNATPTITFSDSDVNYEATIQGLSGSLVLKADANNEFGTESIQFHTGGSQRGQFNASGNLGIGTNDPAAKLHISGNSDVSDADCMLIIDDVDGSAGSRIPAIMFRSHTSGTVTNQGRIRGTDTQGMVLSGSSSLANDLVVSGSSGLSRISIGTTTQSADGLTIGTVNSNCELDMTHTSGKRYRLSSNSDGTLKLENKTDAVSILTSTSAGLVGIGTTSPSSKLHATLGGSVPTISSNTVALFNRSGGVSHEAYVSIIGGADGASTLQFGDTANEDAGRIEYRHDSGGSDYMAITVNTSESLRIDHAGRVGIGNDDAGSMHAKANKLVVGTGSGDQGMSVFAGTSTGWYAFARAVGNNTDAYDGGMSYSGDRDLKFHTNAGSTRMTIDASGNVGIGTTDPSKKLDVRGGSAGGTHSHAVFTGTTGRGLEIRTRSDTAGGQHNGTAELNAQDSEGNGGQLAFSTGGTIRAFLNHNGLGIGTTDPAKLGLTGSSVGKVINLAGDDCQVRLANTILHHDNSGNTTAYLRNHYTSLGSDNNARLRLEAGKVIIATSTSYTERMRIDESGHVGIGSTATSGRLNVENTTNNFAIFAVNAANNYGTATLCHTYGSGTRYLMDFRVGGTAPSNQVGTITSGGSSTAYNTSSDYRLKENVNYTWDALTRLKQLKPARFNFKIDDTNTLVDGFLAHEVSSIVPEAIHGEKDATETYTDDDGNEQTRPVYQGIDQSKLVPLLTKALQEQQTIIEDLKSRIETLEG